MKYPITNTRQKRSVVIPDLAGGMNLRESLSAINDNQMIDCKNMWFKEGMLRTRPALKSNSNTDSVERYSSWDMGADVKLHQDIKYMYDNKSFCLAIKEIIYYYGSYDDPAHTFEFIFINEDDPTEWHKIGEYLIGGVTTKVTYLAYSKDGTVYFLSANHSDETFSVNPIQKFAPPKSSTVTSPWGNWTKTEIGEDDTEYIYVPTVMTNLIPGEKIFGTMIEGYNLLTPYYKVKYSTVNPEQDTTKMEYLLPSDLSELDVDESFGTVIKAEISRGDGSIVEHTVTLNWFGTGEEAKANSDDGLIMKVRCDRIQFFEGSSIKTLSKDDFIRNNLVITSRYHYNKDNLKKVFGMTKSIWFGGSSKGIYGGSRLFLGGNVLEENKSLVIWSDLNNPLYFSENNYAYVGDKSQAVTAFGRQSDTLVIFKEREMYQTQYVYNDSITSEDIMNQSVIDLAAQIVTFPMHLINAHIGCDCPDTVQLCRNRLVWAGSNGKIYTLVSQNQYNERSVFEVSQMIERRLSAEKDLKSAFSADYNDHYILFTDNKAYVMDYNSYGYTHVYSYSKNEDANAYIPWNYWEFPVTLRTVGVGSKYLFFPQFTVAGRYKDPEESTERQTFMSFNMLYIDGEYCSDEVTTANVDMEKYANNEGENWTLSQTKKEISSMVQTKLFDFGTSGYYKNIDTVSFSLGNNGGVPIEISFMTDCGEEQDEIILESDETESYTPGYITSVSRFPCTHSALRFGVKISCEGPLAIDGMTLTYRILGGVR